MTVGTLDDLRKASKGGQDPDPDSKFSVPLALPVCMLSRLDMGVPSDTQHNSSW